MDFNTYPFYYDFSPDGKTPLKALKENEFSRLSNTMNNLVFLAFRNPYIKTDYDIKSFNLLIDKIEHLKNKIVDLQLENTSKLWIYYGTRAIIHFTLLFIAYDVAHRKQPELTRFYYKSKFSPLSLSPIRKRLIIAIGRLLCANGKTIPLASEYIEWVLTTFDFCGLAALGDKEIITLKEVNRDAIEDYIKRNKLTRDEAIKAIATLLSSLT